MKKTTLAFSAAAVLALAGCSTQTAYVNGTSAATAPKTPTFSKSQSFFISGIGQEQTVNAAEVCGSAHRVAKVESSLQPKDIGLGIITFGIYTPRTAKVFCK